MTEMTWPQFKQHHKELEVEEISRRWKAFKEGTYDVDSQETHGSTEEALRETEETEELTQMGNIDPNHGYDLDYIAALEDSEAEILEAELPEPEQAQEELIEATESEGTPPEPPAPTEDDAKLAQRLRDSVIYGL